MKKLLSFLLVTALVFSFAAPLFAQAQQITIGVSIWSSTDTLGSEVKRLLDAAADALDVKLIYVDQAHISEQVTASAETLAIAGCDGIIICNSSSAEMTSVINTCTENEMYVAQFFRAINPEDNPAEYALAQSSKYYVGTVHESEPDNGFQLAQILCEKGARQIGLMGWEPGDATFLGRWEGYKAGVAAWNEANPEDQAVLLEPQYGRTTSDTGRHYADPFFAFMMVYNTIRGKYETSNEGFLEMIFPYMFVSSPEEYEAYATYFTGTELPYYADEIRAMAEYSFDELNEACIKLSVAEVVERHAK
jgi:ribose transport system substrate-binding protein